MELALAAPALLTLIMATWDTANALIIWRQVTSAAEGIVEAATTMADQADGSTSLAPAAAQAAMTTLFADMPGLRGGQYKGAFSVTLSGVVFTPTVVGCVGSCTYVANTAWSVALQMGGAHALLRPCGTLTQTTPTAPQTPSTLPTSGIANLSTIVVADIHYSFTPLFAGFVIGAIDISRSSYLAPRQGKDAQYVVYDPLLGAADPAVCAGYA